MKAPHVRVIVLLGLIAMVSAGCTPAVPDDATPVSQTSVIVAATDAPSNLPTTIPQEQTPTILLPALVIPTAVDVATVSATALPPPTLTVASSPTTAAATPSAAPAAAGDELERDMINLINQSRIADGCNTPMTRSPALTTAARRHSQDMATHNFLGHTGSDGSSRASRAQEAGYIGRVGTRVRENYAAFTNSADVIRNWMQDPATRNQMLDCEYNDIGIGYAKINNSQSSTYWTALFGVRP
jgi:uncharacterized protein YkwD